MKCSIVPLSLVFLLLGTVPSLAQTLVPNGGFEKGDDTETTSWQRFESGYERDTSTVHTGRFSVRCTNTQMDEKRGVSFTARLNQTRPTPVSVSGWSRAQDVSGLPNADYALYVDVTYTDGTNLWGVQEPFDTGTHDWQKRVLLVTPTKPIRELTVYLLLRNHTGTAWFDDVTLTPLPAGRTFDSQLLAPPNLAPGQTEGWFVRDVRTNSPILPPQKLGFTLKTSRGGATTRADIADATGKDRAVTLYYVRRFVGTRPRWWNDLDTAQPAQDSDNANLTPIHAGATGGQSLYPFACVTDTTHGEAIGIPPRLGARVCRLGYHGRAGLLYAAFDVALTTKTSVGKRIADVAVASWKVDPAWGFRDAAAGYYGLFPVAFARRTQAQGIWMPFTAPAKVEKPEDFGFAFHEGDNSVLSDDAQGILSFRYTEPQSYWMVMPVDVPRTYDNAIAQLKREAAGQQGEAWRQRAARAVLLSGIHNPTGQFQGKFENAPWANGIVWFLNANPKIPGADTKAQINYSLAEADKRFTPGPNGILDGEYLDSVEAWSELQDFRRENWRYSTVPLTFTTDTQEPTLPLWFSLTEFVRWEADDLHGRGKLLFGNSLPIRLFAFCPWFDVMGIEVNWISGDNWRPEEESIMRLRRTLSGQKPYLLLMNTDFSKMTSERVEAYFQRCMAWAIFPSMFSVNAADSPYWETPGWYHRDRPLFKMYIPIIKRLSAAGWQPVPLARADNPAVRIERFGSRLFTVRNATDKPVTVSLRFDRVRLGWPTRAITIRDLAAKTAMGPVPATGPSTVSLTLPANGVMALEATD